LHRQRLLYGSLLVALALIVFLFDPAPVFPVLAVVTLALTQLACKEWLILCGTPAGYRWTTHAALAMVLVSNWAPVLYAHCVSADSLDRAKGQAWLCIGVALALALILSLAHESCRFRGPSGVLSRLGHDAFAIIYLGLLPSFLVQLRLTHPHGAWALAAAIFIPKASDTGAFYVGGALGRHRMAPVLSPKKTIEGAVAGVAAAILCAGLLHVAGSAWAEKSLWSSLPESLVFGLVLAVAGQTGDLFESLLKRDSGVKDSSNVLRGMGGVLDVLDSLVLCGPAAYLWLCKPWG